MIKDIDWDKLEAKVHPPMRDELSEAISRERYKRSLAIRLLRIRTEGLRLYEPLPLAERFHACNAIWRLVGESNRAGKSLACYVEDARALTGQDPYDKFPKYNGYALFVGLKSDHIAQMYRGMFREGLFKIIKDEHTKLWRAVRYDRDKPNQLQEYDEAYRETWKDAPPLIPPRMIPKHGIDWETTQEIPRRIRLDNGWRSLWISALGSPEQGTHINLAHFDEEMPNPEFYKEVHRGLMRSYETKKQRPKATWSATSQIANVELADLRDKANADPESDFVQRFTFLVENNPYFAAEDRQFFKDGLSEEDQLTRYHGIPASQVRRIYPTYNPMGDAENGTGHGCEPFPIDPNEYTRYIFLDPSISHCATLLVAIDKLEQYFTIYDGFDIQGATARMWASEIKQRENGVKFECCFIDSRMGKEGLAGREKTTVAEEYYKAIKEFGIQLRQFGPFNGFFPACDDREARIAALISAMEIRGSKPFEGTCRLRIMRGVVPELDKQVRRAQTDPKNPKKWLKNPKIPADFLEDLEYAAAAQLSYVEPEKLTVEKEPTVYDRFIEKQKLRKRREALLQRRAI